MINEQRLVDQFLALCRINSPAKHERAMCDALRGAFEELGFVCTEDDAGSATGGDSGNLVAVLPGTVDGATPVFFSAHMDTVEPNPGLVVVEEDRVLRSDGTTILGADDKAGIAPIIEAMRSVREDGRAHGEVTVVISVCEEIGLLGAKHLDPALLRGRLGFVLDTRPPIGSIAVQAPYQDCLDVTITGKPAHAGAEPEKGISAIQVAARAIDCMKLGRIDSETTANVGIISGGTATNIICPEVQIRAESRSRDGAKLEAQTAHMTEVFRQAAADFGAGVEITVERAYDGYTLAPDSPVVTLARAASERLGLPVEMKGVGGGSDANVFNAAGIPTCVLGTAMDKVHTHEELAAVADLVKTAEWIAAIVEDAAAGAP